MSVQSKPTKERVRREISLTLQANRLNYLDKHIIHEFNALLLSARITTNALQSMILEPKRVDAGISALSYEAFIVHARLLYDFFNDYGTYLDDVHASDFIIEWSVLAKDELVQLKESWEKEKIKENINKRLMHLSFKRDEYPHGFPSQAYNSLICLIVLFLSNLPQELLTEKNRKFLIVIRSFSLDKEQEEERYMDKKTKKILKVTLFGIVWFAFSATLLSYGLIWILDYVVRNGILSDGILPAILFLIVDLVLIITPIVWYGVKAK